jgi:hypothetical protein
MLLWKWKEVQSMSSSKGRVQSVKRAHDGQCLLCGESHPGTLDAHRLIAGSKYEWQSIVTLCATCHRRWHDGQVIFHRLLPSTKGWRLHVTITPKVGQKRTIFIPNSRRYWTGPQYENLWQHLSSAAQEAPAAIE